MGRLLPLVCWRKHYVGAVAYEDEEIAAYDSNAKTWSQYFDGTVQGLGASSNLDIDAVLVP